MKGEMIMLLKCPECELQVSDKAVTCPHCGYPLKNIENKKNYKKRNNKRRRLPNGFGQITELKNPRLRKPFRAMVTVGKTHTGKPITKLLKPEAYFKTYNDAYTALLEYNKNPYDLEIDITVKELYDKWWSEYGVGKKESYGRTIRAAWSYCSSIYNMRAKDVRARHIKGCMENGIVEYNGKIKHTTPSIKTKIKSLFNLMFDYALEYEIVDKNYARAFDISSDILDEKEKIRRAHIPFTDKELDVLWNNRDISYVDVMLLQCYSGWRPQELGLIRIDNVDLDKWVFIGGMKTNAGINRTVPIHTKIRPIVKKLYEESIRLNSEYLINCTDTETHQSCLKMTYDKYRHRFENICSVLKLNPDHRPHDGRNTFITKAKKYNMDEYAIKYIVGHAINDVTEKVYTTRSIDWLQNEMAKIK